MPHFQTADGLTLYYAEEGTGLPVLCLAGLTRNSSDFRYLDGKLANARLIKMDYRGRGKSDWAKDVSTYSILQEAQDALALMDHLGIDKFALLGTSRGGLIGFVIGAMAHDRLLGVALNDIGPEIAADGMASIMGFLGKSPVWKTYAEAAQKRPKQLAGFANVPASRWREEVENLYHQTPAGLIITYDPRLRDAVEAAMAGPRQDLWPMFEALSDLPMAILRGENSDLLTQNTFSEMQLRNPNAIAVTVKDRGHIPFLDEPEALQALAQWTTRIE